MQLTSLLNRWCQVRENLLYAFEHCLDSSLAQPLKQAIRDLLTRIRGGMLPDDALRLFAEYSKDEYFQDLIFALRFNFRHRGNLPALLELLEIQQNKLEEASNDRRISNRNDLRLSTGLIIAVPILFLIRISLTPSLLSLFVSQTLGQALLFIALLCYLTALFWLQKLARQIKT